MMLESHYVIEGREMTMRGSYSQRVDRMLQGATGIMRTESEWRRRARFGGRKGRKAMTILIADTVWRFNDYRTQSYRSPATMRAVTLMVSL